MIIVDKALQQRESEKRPIQVGLVGAGFMGQRLVQQITRVTPGMRVAAISNRTVERAVKAYQGSGISEIRSVSKLSELDNCISSGKAVVTEDPQLLCASEQIEAVIEVTGSIEYAAGLALAAIKHQKHVILMNAELDGTLGPILKSYADRAGVVYTNVDGDQPGTTMNLYRTVTAMGFTPVLCGNIKGLLDHYRTPLTQQGFASTWGQNPVMVTSFADGSKISFEMAVIANATGMGVAKRGMLGPKVPDHTPIDRAVDWFPMDLLLNGPGLVDYVVGAAPSPGVFILARSEEADDCRCLELFKMGPGPLYCFHTPYHLCHFEVPFTVARAVLFNDAAVTPMGRPVVGVVAAAKKALKAGEVLDGIGGYTTYGQCENWDVIKREGLLLQGLAEGCRLKRNIPRDQVITRADVECPKDRVSDRLEAEQIALFG